jgi:hypothetical protein
MHELGISMSGFELNAFNSVSMMALLVAPSQGDWDEI